MAKVKPYIVTVKYIATYSDPAPTEEQILAELNIDALEIKIEEAVVSSSSKRPVAVDHHEPPAPAAQPAPVVDVQVSPEPRKRKKEVAINSKHLSETGPSLQVLMALRDHGPQTYRQLCATVGRTDPSFQVAVSRLKSQGRVVVTGYDAGNKSIYSFVK